jgi:predicted amidophosphoribosyltransferase
MLTDCGRGLLPPTCLLCGADGGADRLDLCEPCLRSLPPAVPLTLPPFALVVCPWIYAYPIDHCIQALKFRGERAWARLFGALLARARRRAGGELPDLAVPVPLHLRRLRERGYNQSTDLARFAARPLALPVDARALERRRATDVQSRLPASARYQRRARPARCWGLRALVDDDDDGRRCCRRRTQGGHGELWAWRAGPR